MAGEAMDAPSDDEAATTTPKKGGLFSPWLRIGASLRKGSQEPRPVKLARLGVSGQGQGDVTPIPPLDDPQLKELDLAPIRPDFSYVRITFHNTRNELSLIHISEPTRP